MKLDRSRAAFEAACRLLPGGVNSPVRSFRAVGGEPVFFERGSGSLLFDLDGNEYIDLVGAYGPLLLGHAHADVVAAVASALERGTAFGAPTEGETALAACVRERMPAVEKMRLVNSGTEAAASAIRLARGATGRDGIVKFAGGYHGHVDALLVEAGSGVLSAPRATSAGIPSDAARHTHVVPYNDAAAVESLLAERGKEIAAVLVEPVAANMGVVPPVADFLPRLREACARSGTLLVFDEVVTGFRLAPGGAQEYFGVKPDLVLLGKVLGGGLPIGAFGGRADLLDRLAPLGPVYQAGTLSGNPLAVAAGLASLQALGRPGVYDRLNALAARLASGLEGVAPRLPFPLTVNRVGPLLGLFFAEPPITDLEGARRSDAARYGRFFHAMLDRGVYFPPSPFEALFLSTAHTERDVDAVLERARDALADLS